MAKGNMLLGYSRGSVGDVVFYRDGGSQRQRARNRKPNNPNTEPQVKQRSRFANAVKFFKQVNSSFFKFAFEDKKTNESDYNAFMRHNVARSGYIGAAANKIANWPALGLWQMSDGSLPKISAPLPQPNPIALSFSMGDGIVIPETAETVGAVSSALVSSSNWREGDIVTFVAYAATPSAGLPTVDTETTAFSASFGYAQFIVNSADTSALPTLSVGNYSFFIQTTQEAGPCLGLVPQAAVSPVPLIGACVIHSRNSSSGLLVSPSDLVWVDFDPNEVMISETPVAAMATDSAYYQQVLADWQAAALAVLQGGAVAGRGGSAVVSATLRFSGTNHAVVIPGDITLSVSGGSDDALVITFLGTAWSQDNVSVSATGQSVSLQFNQSEQYVRVIFGTEAAEDARAGTVVTVSTPAGNIVVTFVE